MLKKKLILLLMALFCFNAYGHADDQSDQVSPQEMKQLSKAFGHFIGRNLNSSGIQFNINSVVQGLRDGAAGKEAPMSDQEYEKLMTRVQTLSYKKIAEKNLKDANNYINSNMNKNGIKEIESGKLYYEILDNGQGDTVSEGATPKIQYTGKFIDGKVFGSSIESGPVSIPLENTIPGFKKGIAGMKEGEKRRLYVHPDLGYGTSGHLPPNSLLIFDVEVIKADSKNDESQDSDEDVKNDEDTDATKDNDQSEKKKDSSWWSW